MYLPYMVKTQTLAISTLGLFSTKLFGDKVIITFPSYNF